MRLLSNSLFHKYSVSQSSRCLRPHPSPKWVPIIWQWNKSSILARKRIRHYPANENVKHLCFLPRLWAKM